MGEDVRSVREHEHRGGVPDAWIDGTCASDEVDAAAVLDARALTTALMRRVDEVRRRRGLTIEQLAARSSLSTSLLHHMANGRPVPSLITLLKLCVGLDVMPNDLMGDLPRPPVRRRYPRDARPLTARERDVFVLLSEGASDSRIAYVLGIGERTVETYCRRVRRKLGVQDRRALAGMEVPSEWIAHPK